MSKKILVLNGSPRRHGNTSALVNAFVKGAESTGNQVTVFHLDSMKLHGCRGCCGGGKNPESPCVQKDDMQQIYPVYREADVVVMASPVYYYNISGQLKNVIDRFFAVAECDPDYRNPVKELVLLMAAEEYGFDEITYWYGRLKDHLGWTSLGEVLCGGVLNVGDIEGREELAQAEALGASIS